jgi:kynurenine formamidase
VTTTRQDSPIVAESPEEPRRLDSAVREMLRALPEPRVFDLGAEIHEGMPQWPDAGSRRLARSWMVSPSNRRGGGEVTFAVEAIEASLHTSTHIDAAVHVQFDGLVRGGEPVDTAAGQGRFVRGGVDEIPPILIPFVLLDVAGAARDSSLPDDAEVEADDLERALRAHDLSIEAESAVLVRTGKIQSFSSGDTYLDAQPGLALSAGEWLCDRGVALLGSDTAGTERIPMDEETYGAVHKLLLYEHDVHLVENLVLDRLAACDCRRGVFICLPLKFVGATASWVRPVAIA